MITVTSWSMVIFRFSSDIMVWIPPLILVRKLKRILTCIRVFKQERADTRRVSALILQLVSVYRNYIHSQTGEHPSVF